MKRNKLSRGLWLAACAGFASLIPGAIGVTVDSPETRTYELTNSPIVILDGSHEEMFVGVGPHLTWLSFDLTQEPGGRLHGLMEADLKYLSVTTNLVVSTITNTTGPGLSNVVVTTVTNKVVSATTNTTEILSGPIAGAVSGNAGQPKVAFSAKVTGWTRDAIPKRLNGRFAFTGKLEGEALTVEGKGSWKSGNEKWAMSFVSRPFRSARAGDPEISISLFPIRQRGDPNRGSAVLTGGAWIQITNATSFAVTGKATRKWDVARGRFEERGSLKGADTSRGVFLTWQAKSNSMDSATARLSGKACGQRFVEAVPLVN